jgi:hypothetical protein
MQRQQQQQQGYAQYGPKGTGGGSCVASGWGCNNGLAVGAVSILWGAGDASRVEMASHAVGVIWVARSVCSR